MPREVDLAGMALFVRIVEHGSLSAAGRSIGLPKATVSRRLAGLERSIGTALLKRSSRALSLTEPGRRYFERVQLIVREAEAAQSEIETANSVPGGTLRVLAPVSIGETIARLPEFFVAQDLSEGTLTRVPHSGHCLVPAHTFQRGRQ